MKKLLPFTLLIIFFTNSCKQSGETRSWESDTIVEQLNEQVHPLESPLPTSSFSDLSPLEKAGGKTIVAMGEATHGTREFFQLKHKIFRYLVEEHDFRIFAFEADMGESIYINRYIQGGEGNIAHIMANKMLFWTWKTKEVKALFDWMRSFNEEKLPSERIYFIGLDSQYMIYQPTLIKEYIKKVKPAFLEQTESILANVTKPASRDRAQIRNTYQGMTEKRKEAISDTLDYLMQRMESMKEEMASASSDFEYESTLRLVKNIQQVHKFLYALENQNSGLLRDKYMAENTLWASQLFGEKTKIAVWAHNGHISESQTEYEPMGYHLNNKIGDNYKSIAFSFNSGTFNARGVDSSTNVSTGTLFHTIDSEPPGNSINNLFSNSREENFIFNIGALESNSALSDWLSNEHGLLEIGAVYNGNPEIYYRPTVLPESYDFIIHVDSTNHSTSVL